jgi:hypothetical protein
MTIRRKGMIFIALVSLFVIPVLNAQQAPAPPVPPAPPVSPAPRSPENSAKPISFYRLDFAIREMDGEKALDTRHYSLWLQAGEMERIQSSSSATYGIGDKKTVKNNIGVSFLCTVKETDSSPWLDLQLQISDFIPPEKAEAGTNPVARGIDIHSKAPLSLGKSVTVSSVEDPVSRHRFQVDVIATKLK